jgi:hypothetical protein
MIRILPQETVTDSGILNRKIYLAAYQNHPSTVWIRNRACNYNFVLDMCKELFSEYVKRYNKIHKSSKLIEYLSVLPKFETPSLAENFLGSIPQCMPDSYKIVGDPVEAYRAYYRGEKSRFAKWNYSEKPGWM